MRTSSKRAIALVATSGLLLAAVPIAAEAMGSPGAESSAEPTKQAPAKVRLLSWNICGTPPNDKPTKYPCRTKTPDQKIDRLMQEIRQRKPDVIMLQETCKIYHTIELQNRLGGPGRWKRYSYEGKDVLTGKAHGCKQLDEPGQKTSGGFAILMRRATFSKDLKGKNYLFKSVTSDLSRAPQGAACIKDRLFKIMACTTHFVGDSDKYDFKEIRKRSAGDFAKFADTQRRVYGYRMIIGGDLNAPPGDEAIERMQSGRREVDRIHKCSTASPKGTNGRCKAGTNKIDHIFYDKAGWKADTVEGGVTHVWNDISDHRMIWGEAEREKNDRTDHAKAAPNLPPNSLPCRSRQFVKVCWQRNGDKIWVLDKVRDGNDVTVEWSSNSNERDKWRSGLCTSKLGKNVWGVCNKNLEEGMPIGMRGARIEDNGTHRQWTRPLESKV